MNLAPRIPVQLGLYEKAIHASYSWSERLNLAKEAGFSFMELSIDESNNRLARLDWTKQQWLELKALSQQLNCPIKSLCLSAHRRFPLGSVDPVIREKALLIFNKALEVCRVLDIKLIQLAGYDVYYEPSNDQTKQNFLIGLQKISAAAKEKGIYLGIETMDTLFLGTAERVRHYVKTINNPYLRTYPDLGNLFQWSEDPIYDIENNVCDFLQVHFKATRPNQFRDVAWEDSNVPYQVLLSTLIENNYQANFVAEAWAEKADCDREHQRQNLFKAYNFVSTNLKQVGYQPC